MPSFDPTNLSGIRKVFTSPTENDQYGYSELALQSDVQDAAQLSIEWLCTSVTRVSDGVVLIPDIDLDALTARQIYTLDPSLYTVNATADTVTVTAASVTGSTVSFGGEDYARGTFVIDGAQPLRIERSTDIDSSLISYQPGSRLSHLTLNASNLQLLFAMQEFTVDLNSISAVAGTIDLSNESIGDIGNVTLDALAADELLISNSSGVFVNKTLAEADIASSTDLTALTGRVTQNETDIAAIPTNLILTTSSIGDLFDVDSSGAILNDVLKWDGSEWKPGVASVVASLDDLTDVSVTTPTAGDILQYDVATSKFTNQTPETSTVTLPTGRVSWNQDSITFAANGNINVFNSTDFPNVILTDPQPLTSDFQTGTTTTDSGFIVPETGSYMFVMEASLKGTSNQLMRVYGNFMVNGTNVSSSTLYNYDVSNGNDLHPMTDTQTLELTAGDCVSYKLSGQSASGDITFQYGGLSVVQLTFDANLYASEVIESDIVNTPTGDLNVEQRVGITDEGKPVYCRTRRWHGTFQTGVTVDLWPDFYDGRQLISVEPILLNDTTTGKTFLSESAHALYGFEITKNGDDIDVSRIASPTISADCGALSSGHYNIFYTKDSDVAQPTMTVVPTGTIKALESVYYLEGTVQDQLSVATANEAKRTYGNSSEFSNTGISVEYGTAQTSDWADGIWTCPADGLYEVSTQFGLNLGTNTQAMSYVEANPGSGFNKLGTNFHMRGLDPGNNGIATQRLYMSSYQVIREFQQGTQVRVRFENDTDSGASSMDIENAKASIRKIGPYTS